jgi:hypothetical protein
MTVDLPAPIPPSILIMEGLSLMLLLAAMVWIRQ